MWMILTSILLTFNNNMNAMDQLKEELSLEVFGRSRVLAQAVGQCVSCGKTADSFRDQLSLKEYGISGLCQICQDQVFGDE